MHPIYRVSPLYTADDIERRGSGSAKSGDHRDPFEVDRARIIHSFAFRRLQSKTQIFNLNESSFLRTRLTHSLEVGNIGRALAAAINEQIASPWPCAPGASPHALAGPVDASLIEAACLAHDLGHPPFGHRGEEALNHAVWTRWPGGTNGFEGNGQTLRLLTHPNLEVHPDRHGLNLTRATLLAVLKYPATYADTVAPDVYPADRAAPPFKPWAPPKCVHNEERAIVDWLLAPFPAADRARFTTIARREGRHARTMHKTLEASIVELADDIAYGTHDVEDAFFLGLADHRTVLRYLDRSVFDDPARYDWYEDVITAMARGRSTDRGEQLYEKKGAASALINALIVSVALEEDDAFEHPRLRWRATLPHDARLVLEALKRSIYDVVINGPAVQSLEYRGGLIITRLFDAYWSSPELLGGRVRHHLREASSEEERLRALTDHIAGMTDDFAERVYNRLFQPGSGSLLERM